MIAGIVYAADIGANVINLSVDYRRYRLGGINYLGTEDPSDDVPYTAQEVALLIKAFSPRDQLRARTRVHDHRVGRK